MAVYYDHQDEFDKCAIHLAEARKATEKKVQEAMGESEPSSLLEEAIAQMCDAQETASQSEQKLSWAARFKKTPTVHGPDFTPELCMSFIEAGKVPLQEMLVVQNCPNKRCED